MVGYMLWLKVIPVVVNKFHKQTTDTKSSNYQQQNPILHILTPNVTSWRCQVLQCLLSTFHCTMIKLTFFRMKFITYIWPRKYHSCRLVHSYSIDVIFHFNINIVASYRTIILFLTRTMISLTTLLYHCSVVSNKTILLWSTMKLYYEFWIHYYIIYQILCQECDYKNWLFIKYADHSVDLQHLNVSLLRWIVARTAWWDVLT